MGTTDPGGGGYSKTGFLWNPFTLLIPILRKKRSEIRLEKLSLFRVASLWHAGAIYSSDITMQAYKNMHSNMFLLAIVCRYKWKFIERGGRCRLVGHPFEGGAVLVQLKFVYS